MRLGCRQAHLRARLGIWMGVPVAPGDRRRGVWSLKFRTASPSKISWIVMVFATSNCEFACQLLTQTSSIL
jgi:hypothetical protein